MQRTDTLPDYVALTSRCSNYHLPSLRLIFLTSSMFIYGYTQDVTFEKNYQKESIYVYSYRFCSIITNRNFRILYIKLWQKIHAMRKKLFPTLTWSPYFYLNDIKIRCEILSAQDFVTDFLPPILIFPGEIVDARKSSNRKLERTTVTDTYTYIYMLEISRGRGIRGDPAKHTERSFQAGKKPRRA